MILNQITLPVDDMGKACIFYRKLGFTQIVDTPHYARFETGNGGPTFSLSLDDTPVNGATIYFEDENLDEWVARLKAKGIEFDSDPVDQRYLWREASLCDPSGNKIKLYKAGDARLNPPWRVDLGEID